MADRVVNTPVTITVAEIVAVPPGRKQGKIIGTDGSRWQVWDKQISEFHIGGAYKILSHKEGEFTPPGGSPILMKTIGDFQYIGAPTQAQQRAIGANQANTPNAPANSGVDYETIRRRDIFVCGAINNILSNSEYGVITEAELAAIVIMLKRVWENTLGPNAKSMAPPVRQNEQNDENNDMSDSIPF